MTSYATEARATEPLIPREVRRATAKQLLEEVAALMAAEQDAYHDECWRRYLKQHSIPPAWRGRKDSYHYDRLMAGLTRIERRGRGLPRVKYALFLREHIRENPRIGKGDVAGVMAWFRGLDRNERRRFTDIHRDEEAQAKREERLYTRLMFQQDAYYNSPFNYEDLDDEPVLRSVSL
jgi:hypothetical protein